MADYKHFPTLKFKNYCQKCRRELPEGTPAWGTKEGFATRWKFLCDACYATLPPSLGPPALPPDAEVETITLPDGMGEALAKMAGAPPARPPRPLLEVLKETAPWRFEEEAS